MAAPYLKELVDLISHHSLDLDVEIECKHFFSGAAAYANGHIFMTLTPVALALKLPESLRESLIKKGAVPLRYFPKAPIKKDYVVLPRTLRQNEKNLADWIKQSVSFSLPSPG